MARFTVLCYFLGLYLWPVEITAQSSFKNILIVFGANETRPAYSRILEGIKSSFPADSAVSVNLITEYLNLERFSDSSTIRRIVNLYNNKIREEAIDLVVTVAPGAYEVLKEYHFELLTKVPVINLELSPKSPEDYLPDSRLVELHIDWSPGISMAHAFDLFPNSTHAYILGGCAESDRKFTSAFASDTAQFADSHQFTFLSCTTMEDLLDTVERIREGSLVFLASYAFDADSTPYSTAIVLRFVASHSVVPVFTMSDNFIEIGGVGGRIISFLEVGREAGRIAKGLLKEDQEFGFTRITKSFYQYQYNWKELEKWKLCASNVIPDESIFFYRNRTFVEEYRWQLTGILILILFLSLIVIYLFKLLRVQRKLSIQKNKHDQLYRQLLRDERVTTMSLLTASLAHELNQPLAAILFNAQAGLRFYQSGRLTDQQSSSILSDIETDVKRASGIISNLRSLMNVGERLMKEYDLNGIIREVLEILHTELKHKDVQIELDLAEIPLVVHGVKVEIQQVLINLIINAVRAMQSNPPENKRIFISTKLKKDHAFVSIEDDGPGLPDHLRDMIFDVFMTTEKAGMGIGLALCKSIIERHGGEIRAENRPEKGARFSFSLPQNHHK